MRSSNTGLSHGTSGSPQESIESLEYGAKVQEIEAKLSDVMETVVSPTKMRNIRKSLESKTVWDQLKTTGATGVGAGNPRSPVPGR